MTRALLLAALLAATAAPAAANDPRLVEHLYNPDEVVRVEGRPNVQATIRFADDEHIENVAIGDSTKWQVTPNKRANLLFVKPMAERAVTNMTVVTDRHTYMFDLVASPLAKAPLYVLSFTYPAEDKPHAELATATDGPNAVEVAAVTDPRAVIDPATLNFAWHSKGTRQLVPARVFDDGQSTFLSWPAGAAMPAILIKNAQGVEGPVNYAVRGDVIVVEGVPREIVLRSGNNVANLTNDGPERQPRLAAPALAQASPAQDSQGAQP
jgi:type IV secretion system protein VirB9